MDSNAATRIDVAPLSCTTFVASPHAWTLIADDDRHDTDA
ncbi:hypothetical protein BSFP_036450 [Burkholderia stabilis]|uniref:Uncharacterized protein n=1 Tax=Burkholderia stabilis TaxID=95485 RepID=A0A1Y1BQZ0_9BURK|nr:hypothetical protein BSFP_036450 [Burkholderia stabilis]